MSFISAGDLAMEIQKPDELAILDGRSHASYAHGHLLWAASLRVEAVAETATKLIPRLATPIVVIDDGGGEAQELGSELQSCGWENVRVLKGGMTSWIKNGYEVYTGVNVPSKLFGELAERYYRTPHVKAATLNEWLATGRELLILDSRTADEFERMSLPGGLSCPGGELIHRVFDLLEDDITVVVNCAGRTRSIIGAQSLIRAGIANPVVALENGTMGWELAGLTLVQGDTSTAQPPTPAGRSSASIAATQVAVRYGIEAISQATLEAWKEDKTRTVYLFDVRTPAEYEAGHRHDFRNAPGGQLVQATDEYAVVRGARLVLADDDLTRATMSASWLQEMGWEVYVYALGKENEPLRTGKSPAPSHSPQVTLPRDPADSQVALRGMQEYLDWEIALVDQYDRDELARFTENGWA